MDRIGSLLTALDPIGLVQVVSPAMCTVQMTSFCGLVASVRGCVFLTAFYHVIEIWKFQKRARGLSGLGGTIAEQSPPGQLLRFLL